MDDPMGTVCAEVGEEIISATVAAFYRRVSEDDLLRPLYPEQDLGPAEERLADFLIGRFGGSNRYVETRGHPRLRMRHGPFRVDLPARDRWVSLMHEAIEEVALPASVRQRVTEFLEGVATFLINRS